MKNQLMKWLIKLNMKNHLFLSNAKLSKKSVITQNTV